VVNLDPVGDGRAGFFETATGFLASSLALPASRLAAEEDCARLVGLGLGRWIRFLFLNSSFLRLTSFLTSIFFSSSNSGSSAPGLNFLFLSSSCCLDLIMLRGLSPCCLLPLICCLNFILILSRLLTNLLGEEVVPPLVGTLEVSGKAVVVVLSVVGKL